MSAICTSCTWTGSSPQVIDGGRCPECHSKVKYESRPLDTSLRITSIVEFNRRAGVAIAGLKKKNDFITDCAWRIKHNLQISDKQQKALYNTIHSRRAEISDQALKDYAADRAKGFDY